MKNQSLFKIFKQARNKYLLKILRISNVLSCIRHQFNNFIIQDVLRQRKEQNLHFFPLAYTLNNSESSRT